jgi:hypothetical protein
MRFFTAFTFVAFCLGSSFASAQLDTGWKAHDLSRPAPTVVKPSENVGGAPSDAIVLFDGTDMSMWRGRDGEAKWKIVDGAMESVPKSGFVFTKQEFGDCQVHLEFASPKQVKGNSQGRGNSGVFLMGEFEVQVLDSFENTTYADGSAGSVYGQYPPLVNASRAPGEWQSYDIVFRRPRFTDGRLSKPAQITVLHNGVVVQDASEAFGPTSWILHKNYGTMKNKTKGPLSLQDHGNPVRYRNIWVRPLVETQPQPEQAYDPVKVDLEDGVCKKLVGKYGNHRVEFKNDRLTLFFNGFAALHLIPHSPTEFGLEKSAGMVTFAVDEEGNGTGLELKLDAAGTRKADREQAKPKKGEG